MKWIFALVGLVSFACSADWFGPKSFEDCITESMKGVTSDVAASEIKKACRSKFPAKKAVIEKIDGESVYDAIDGETLKPIRSMFSTSSSKADHEVTFHNQLDKEITYLILAISVNNQKQRLYRVYCGTPSLSAGTCYGTLGLGQDEKITSWRVQSVELKSGDSS